MKKYEFTGEVKFWFGHTLRGIRATVSFGAVKAGELGGWIEKEENLDGNAWVSGNARVSGDAHYLTVGPIGSRAETTTFFRTKNGEIFVSCGCFLGNLEAFENKVKETHGDNNHAKIYRLAAEMARLHIDLAKEEG